MLVIQRPTVNAVADADGNRQQFSIEPLEPGFGHTLGQHVAVYNANKQFRKPGDGSGKGKEKGKEFSSTRYKGEEEEA